MINSINLSLNRTPTVVKTIEYQQLKFLNTDILIKPRIINKQLNNKVLTFSSNKESYRELGCNRFLISKKLCSKFASGKADSLVDFT